MKKDSKEHKEILEVFKGFCDAYGRQDIDGVMDMFVPSPSTIFIGTGLDEECVGAKKIKDQFTRDFTQSEKLKMEVKWHQIAAKANTAWLASEVDVHTRIVGRKMDIFTRITAVLEKDEENWRFAHMHISMPSNLQRKGESFPSCDLY